MSKICVKMAKLHVATPTLYGGFYNSFAKISTESNIT